VTAVDLISLLCGCDAGDLVLGPARGGMVPRSRKISTEIKIDLEKSATKVGDDMRGKVSATPPAISPGRRDPEIMLGM